MHKRSSSKTDAARIQQNTTLPRSVSSSSQSSSNEGIIAGVKLYGLISEVTSLLNEIAEENKGKGKEDPGLVNKIQTCSSEVRDSTILVRLLCAIVLEASDSETKRVAGKVDRALERLRRLISAWLDRFSAVADQVFSSTKELFSVIAEILRLTIRDVLTLKTTTQVAPFLSDLTTRALDSLFTLAKLTLKVSHPETYTHTYDVLGTAASILTEVNPSGIPLANFLRCLSGAYYNFAGNLYQAGQHEPAVPFLKEACNLGAKALSRRSKAKNDGEEKAREQEGWKQLEETLFRRWELLGICYMKIGDRKNAYIAFLRSLVMFPYALYDLPTETGKIPPSRIFSSSKTSTPFTQLAAVIDRVTHIGLNELLLSVDQISLQHSLSSSESMRDPRLIGILIEEQVKSLEQRNTRDSTQKSIRALLESALKVYSRELNLPVRRARVTLRLLEALYRIDNALPFGEIQAMAQEIDTLLLTEDLGGDTELDAYRAQYRALGYLWLALHAHRAAVSNQVSLVADHVEQACRILRSLFPKTSTDSPKVAIARKSLTPQQPMAKMTTRARTRTAVTTAATGATTRSKARVAPTAPTTAASKKMSTTTKKKEPLTPAPKRGVLQPMPLNTETPPRTKIQAIKPPLVFDDFDRFSGVLQTVVRVLGLLSLSLQKVQLLDVLRKLAEAHGGPTSEGYINASLDLAHEYMRIGKTRRATAIFTQALETVRAGHVSEETSALFLLRFAESLALIENVPRSSSVYCEALAVSKRIEYDEKSETTVQRVHARVRRLEKAALAARTVAMIQYCKEDLTMSIELLLQSLRLWNRAMDNLMRLSPLPSASKQPAQDDNPFDMSSLKQALPSEAQPLPDPTPQIVVPPQRHLDNLSLRISEGLFAVLFDLAQAYLIRGSAKESEFFITQALDLAKALNAPAMLSRALAKQGEVQVRLGNTKDGYTLLVEAGEVLSGVPTIDNVEVVRLTAECRAKMGEEDAGVLYDRSVDLLREIDVAFEKYEIVTSGPRKSLGLSPVSGKSVKDIVVPDILTSVLRQQIWLLRDQNDEQLKTLLEQFGSLPQSSLTKAQENSLLAKLNLHNVYFRFQSDMFLNSLAESPIAIPMGMHATQKHASISAQDINNALDQAEEQFWNSLALIARRGNVLDVRESTVALAVIKSFQTSMGHKNEKIHVLVSRLLDAAAALTLRREMLEAIHHKFPRSPSADDMRWPLITAEGAMLPPPVAGSNFAARKRVNIPVDSEDDDDDDEKSDAEATPPLKSYWESVRMRYRSYSLDSSTLSSSQTEKLPSNWTVIHINVTEDKDTLFVSRQEGGAKGDGLVFSVPLKSRRDNGSGDDDEDYLTFHDVMHELREIVKLSDQGTKAAVHIKPDDGAARASWWKQRAELDSRLKNLLENIEFCWFGAFKTILSPKCTSSHEAITVLGDQFEKVFRRSFGIQDMKRGGNPRKTSAQHLPQSFNQVRLDDSLLRCFSTLSPKCRDEELEDLIYFILDLYQFHGVAIPISEVDITQMVVDLRTILEEHTMKTRGQINKKASTIAPESDDEHVFLVLDKNLQGLPWESIPILRGRSVSRIPSVDFLIDRLEYVEIRKRYRRAVERTSGVGAVVDPRKGFFILNPSGDLRKTQERFKDWADGMKKTGWDGVVGKPISEQQFENALRQSDLVVYFGHGGGEQYLRSYKIRRLQTCAATMLWGCSSGALREMGDFDRTGTANAYMLGGCPTLVANLWDVTDRDIDKFSQAVFDKVKLTPETVRAWSEADTAGVSLVSAVAQARSVCKLKYLTGAAPVVYGIPFYL